jgi:aryl-alcohol dehydrogenase-like predicted oxidoreductase
MDYTHLGRAGLRVSRLCLGTMNFGPQTTEPDSHAILDQALDAGINFMDTANVYGWKTGEGVTENILGRWFAQGGGRREKTVLATKLYGGMGDWPNQTFLSALSIRQQCDASLKRLQTDYIDLYQMHHIDREAPWEELWEAFDVLKQQGKVLYVGSSNFPGWGIAQANERAKQRGTFGLVSEQSYYNLMSRTVELEVVPACEQYGVGLIPWSPLNRGLLGGILRKETEGRSAAEHVQKSLADHRPAIEAYEAFCDELGKDPADVGLAWLLAQPAVTAPIVGPRTADQLTGALRSLEVTLGEAELKRLDEIFPGPGGPAPEAYAW